MPDEPEAEGGFVGEVECTVDVVVDEPKAEGRFVGEVDGKVDVVLDEVELNT